MQFAEFISLNLDMVSLQCYAPGELSRYMRPERTLKDFLNSQSWDLLSQHTSLNRWVATSYTLKPLVLKALALGVSGFGPSDGCDHEANLDLPQDFRVCRLAYLNP